MEDEGIGFELVAASLRTAAANNATFLTVLAKKLTEALPKQTRVHYKGGLFGKKSIGGVECDLGDVRYSLEEQHGRLEACRQKVVRGIVLKSEIITLDEWIDELSQRVAEEARQSETGQMALRRMLEES